MAFINKTDIISSLSGNFCLISVKNIILWHKDKFL